MEVNPTRAEAERLLGIAEKLLQGKDFNGSRDFAVLAQETDPLLDGSDQILAVVDVLIASQKRINNHHDWYSILQIDHQRRHGDPDLVKKQYRRLAFLLHPDKNRFPFAESAFRIVAEAWAVLSDATKKMAFDNELNFFSKVDLVASKNQRGNFHHHPQNQPTPRREQEDPVQMHQKLPVRRTSPWAAAPANTSAERGSTSGGGGGGGGGGGEEARPGNFWTACPYCYNLYEYPKVYVDCCLRCQNCERAFHATAIPSLPPIVPGKEAYHCCWGFFPMGFTVGNVEEEGGKKAAAAAAAAAPSWIPAPPPPPPQPAAPAVAAAAVPNGGGGGFVDAAPANAVPAAKATPAGVTGAKKRGRPRKNVQV